MVRLMFYAVTSPGINMLANHFGDDTIFIHSHLDSNFPMHSLIKEYEGGPEAVTAIANLYKIMLPGYTIKQLIKAIDQEYSRTIKAGICLELQTGIFIQSLHTIPTFKNI